MKNSRTRILILQWFEMSRVGEYCSTNDICNYVRRYSKKKPSRKTIRNNITILKSEGQIAYREIRMIEIGEPHSL